MELLLWIIAFSLIGGIGSTVGGVLLLWKEELARKLALGLISFAAGALMGAAFLELFPEAVEQGSPDIFIWAIAGLLVVYITERWLNWHFHHHHHAHCHHAPQSFSYTILIGDSIHNFIDGVIIATTFLVSVPLGIVTALAIIAHELPQEIGDFAIMLYGGMRRLHVLLLNWISALLTVVGALAAWSAAEAVHAATPSLLAFAAGTFIYIAGVDLIPETQKERTMRASIVHTLLLLAGISVVWLAGVLLGV